MVLFAERCRDIFKDWMLGRLENYTGVGVFLFGGGITRRAQELTPHIKLSSGEKSQWIIFPIE